MSKLFSYVDYERISDDIYFLGGSGKFILRMNVSLAKRKDKNNDERRYFYNEYNYDSKYSDKGQVVSIRRSYDYYMTLESLDDRLNGIMIRPQDMILLRSRLSEVLSWFVHDIFIVRKGKLMISARPKPIVIGGFADSRSIGFEPIVIDWEDGNQSRGARITLSDVVFSDITIDRMYGFVYIINSIDMVQSAQAMLAFMGMPEYGTNRHEIDVGYSHNNEVIEPKSTIKDRDFKAKGKSYFDMI